jgi:hypothetical protein
MELNAIDVYTDTVKFFCVNSWMFDIGMGSHAAVQSAGTLGIWGRGSQACMNWKKGLTPCTPLLYSSRLNLRQ